MDGTIDLQTWQQAFEQHPIASTRAIEKQLRVSVANSKEKLRVLVGGNYRQLLSTAEQIVALDGQAKSAESHISEIGQQCNPPSRQHHPDAKAPRRQILAQLRLLQRCLAAAKSALGQSELLLAAQLAVVSRLLLKSLDDEESSIRTLPSLRDRAALLRRQLLRYVEITITRPQSVLSTMVNASCAHCLITSASFQDVFRYIHRLRIERLRKSLQPGALSEQHVVDGLRYYVASLRMLGALMGRSMTDALGNLQKRPVLQEPLIADLELLDLKGIGQLIPEEIRSFIPYFKRTPFSAVEIRQALQKWSSEASPIIAEGVERLLEDQKEIGPVLDLRKELFSTLLPIYFTLPGSSSVHQALRDVLSKRLDSLSQSYIRLLLTYTNEALSLSNVESSAESLWQEDIAKMSLDHGASSFLQQVHRRRRGKSLRLARVSWPLVRWIASTKELLDLFQNLQNVRWRDVLEEPDDDQVVDAENVIKGLSKDDPDLYSTQMQHALKRGFEDVENSMMTSISQRVEQKALAQEVVEYIRIVREVVEPLRQAFTEEARFEKLNGLIPRLHQIIANEVVDRVCISLTEARTDSSQQEDYAIDNVPSPRAFAFLRRLCTVMSELGGTDIWSPAAVRELRGAAANRVLVQDQKDLYVESEFDEVYISAALQASYATSDKPSEQARAAKEYWIRTRLLFGVLSN